MSSIAYNHANELPNTVISVVSPVSPYCDSVIRVHPARDSRHVRPNKTSRNSALGSHTRAVAQLAGTAACEATTTLPLMWNAAGNVRIPPGNFS